MTWLLGFLSSLMSSALTFLVSVLSAKVVIALYRITVVVAVTAVAFAGVKALFVGLAYVAPAELTQAASLVVPGNAYACISAVLSARIIVWAWSWKKYYIEMAVSQAG